MPTQGMDKREREREEYVRERRRELAPFEDAGARYAQEQDELAALRRCRREPLFPDEWGNPGKERPQWQPPIATNTMGPGPGKSPDIQILRRNF